ncbi:MAG TPA: hypothetical protein VM848_01750 [Acidimicrobiia bacterium]|nr:hypothetical protein [Acidimicrobiia bacterium]
MAITAAGIDKINEVWPDHLVSIPKHFGQYLNLEDAKALEAAAKKILNGGRG